MNLVTKNGISLMHIAAQADQAPFLVFFFADSIFSKVYLRYKGMDPAITDKFLATPLHWACYFSAENAVNYLLAWIKNVNMQDSEGFTPLHLATWSSMASGNLRPVKFLLLRGADRQIQVFSNIFKKTVKKWIASY